MTNITRSRLHLQSSLCLYTGRITDDRISKCRSDALSAALITVTAVAICACGAIVHASSHLDDEPEREAGEQVKAGTFTPVAQFLGTLLAFGVSASAAALTLRDENGGDITDLHRA